MTEDKYRQDLAAGEWLFRQGDPGSCAYLIESGRLEVCRGDGSDPEVIAVLGPGEVLGEMALIDGLPRSASARAQEHTRLRVLTRTYLQERLDTADPLLRLLLNVILERYRSMLPTQGHVPVGVANLDGGDTTRDRKEALTHLRLEQELEQALERGEFRLLYQPIVCLADCTTAGFEALIRWASPTRGLVPPDQFIPAAEESQLIVDIGRWTLRAGCAAIRRMEQLREQTAGPPGHPLFISVNLAARQLATKDIYEDVTRAVLDAGIAPPQLKLELTEGQLIGNWDRSMDLLNRLRAFGVQVAVDDFGTGYSSLSYLHRFPVDTLKIDRSFVASLLENERSREILRMLGQLARALSMHIIAEGVEHPEQASYLGMLGFEFAQGYLFSRPVSEEQAAALVNKRWEVGGLVVPCNPGKVGLHSDS